MRISLVYFLTLIIVKCPLEYVSEDLSLFDDSKLEIIDLLGIQDPTQRMKRHPSLRASASKFLLNVYKELKAEEEVENDSNVNRSKGRLKRSLHANDEFADNCFETGSCNNIVTFANMGNEIGPPYKNQDTTRAFKNAFKLRFNLQNVPSELRLISATMRIYQDPELGKVNVLDPETQYTVSVYRVSPRQRDPNTSPAIEIYGSRNTTAGYKGWLEFNTTQLLGEWLDLGFGNPDRNEDEILVTVTTSETVQCLSPQEIGLINTNLDETAPFIIAYFNGPDLMAKMHKLRSRRDVSKTKHRFDYRNSPYFQPTYQQPKNCVRLNFTLDFKDLHMQNWVIAPKKFEAYVCSGECNFPLGSSMNATNHAIVQTLMHLKRQHLPKPCCVPTSLGSISILHYLNEDSVNLSKYPQSVAKECGCH